MILIIGPIRLVALCSVIKDFAANFHQNDESVTILSTGSQYENYQKNIFF